MTTTKIKSRLAKDKLMLWSICLFAALTAVPLLAILGEVLLRGYDQLSWQFFTEPTPTAYKAMKAIEAGEPIPGGIANGIVGTMIMLGMAVVFAVPTGILCGAYLAENTKNRFARIVSYLTDLLQGTPSVIIGIITYIWVVVPMKGYSAIAGSVAPIRQWSRFSSISAPGNLLNEPKPASKRIFLPRWILPTGCRNSWIAAVRIRTNGNCTLWRVTPHWAVSN